MRVVRLGALSLITAFAQSAAAAPQCDDWRSGPFIDQPQGLNGQVEAAMVWTPPGGPELLVVGGHFTQAGGVQANRIAAWDGASWRALGSGMDGGVFELFIYNGDLIAGGDFDTAGGVSARNIARFDGSAWHPLANGLGLDALGGGSVHAFTVYNGELIAGGRFTLNTGQVICRNIARWNGTIWNVLSIGVTAPVNEVVRALQVYDGHVIAGGCFNNAGGVNVSNIARWNGTSWSAMPGGGANNFVNAIQAFSGGLAIGGDFNQAGGNAANHVAVWNGSSWAGIGAGLNNSVFALAVYQGELMAGGTFTDVGIGLETGDRVARFTGGTWMPLLDGVWGPPSPAVFALAVFSAPFSRLYIGGDFSIVGEAGGIDASNIAQWDDFLLFPLEAPGPHIKAMSTLGSRIVAAGFFAQSTNGPPAFNIGAWNGLTLAPLVGAFQSPSGLNGTAECMLSFSQPGPQGGPRLVVAGSFTTAGGIPANGIAMYSESTFVLPTWSALGAGLGSVRSLERHNNQIYAGNGSISQFNGTSWVSIGSTNGTVLALRSYNGMLYAGGTFTNVNGVATGGLARWNGTSWSNVGGFFGGTVNALEVHNSELIIGGAYPGLPNAPNIARFNSVTGTYNTFSGVGTNGPVHALKSVSGFVYVGGAFTGVGALSASRIARWSVASGWSEVRGGTNNIVRALAAHHSEVHAGGEFTTVGTTAISSPAWGRYLETGAPWIAQQPSSQTVDCGQNVAFSIQPAVGYTGLTFVWRKDGVPLGNGPTPHGSIISGATTAQLSIASVSSDDAGAYTCSVSNSCGSETSFAATLTIGECCAADVDGSGAVDVDDLIAVILAWGDCPAPPAACDADVNDSSAVDVDDLIAVILAWGECS
jgi:trimeric autotransporter adhesin